MNDITLDGVASLNGGEYKKVKVNGVGTCQGKLKAQIVDVDGVFTCHGSLDTGMLDCDGVATFHAPVKAGKIDVSGTLTVKGSKIEASEIYCDGLIKVAGELSADIIEADGCIHAKEVVGDNIRIRSRISRIVNFFSGHSNIDLIEATDINLRGVYATSVNGKNIRIGPKCKIDTVDCSGHLSIHPNASVGTITGNYTKDQ